MVRVKIKIGLGMIHLSKMELFRYGIIAIASPRVATEDSADSKIQPLQSTVTLNSLHSILRTSGREAAGRRSQWTDTTLIEANGQNEDLS